MQERIDAGELNELGEPLRPATCTQCSWVSPKASLATDTFLSAASFQETTKVLTEPPSRAR